MSSPPNPVQRALAKFDNSPTKMAAALDPTGDRVKRQHVEHWLKVGRIPEKFVRQIHELCSADPACWECCPEDWWRIWPDLRGRPGAPVIPDAANDESRARA